GLGTRADRRSFALSSPRFRDDGRRFRRGFRSASVSIGTGFNDYDYPYYNDYAFAGSYPGYYDDYAFVGPRYRSIYAASPACTCGSYGAYGAYGSVGFGWGSGWGWDWRSHSRARRPPATGLTRRAGYRVIVFCVQLDLA